MFDASFADGSVWVRIPVCGDYCVSVKIAARAGSADSLPPPLASEFGNIALK
jgi:hypothetical protein